MKTELEVARDAVRSAGLEELADALEWAAAAVRHRATLLSAARWAATDSEAPCPSCGDYNLHARECPTANMLHALDSEWSQRQVEAAHADAPRWAPRRLWPMHELGGNRIPPRPAPDTFDAMAYAMENITAAQAAARRAERLRSSAELLATADPMRLTYSTNTFRPLGVTVPQGMMTMGIIAHAASPQPAQPQPEDEPADE